MRAVHLGHLLWLLDGLLVLLELLELLNHLLRLWLVLLLKLMLLLLLLLKLLHSGSLLILNSPCLQHQVSYVWLRSCHSESLLGLDLCLHRLEMCLRNGGHWMGWYKTASKLGSLDLMYSGTSRCLHWYSRHRSSLSCHRQLPRNIGSGSCVESICSGHLRCSRLSDGNRARGSGNLANVRTLLDDLSTNQYRTRVSGGMTDQYRTKTYPFLHLSSPGILGHPFCKLLVALPPHQAVLSRRLIWDLLPYRRLGLVGFTHRGKIGSLRSLLGIAFTFLRQLPHCINHGQVFLVATPFDTDSGSRPPSRYWGNSTIWTNLLLGLLIELLDGLLRGVNPPLVGFEVWRFPEIVRQTFELDPTLKALPRCSTFCSRREQGWG